MEPLLTFDLQLYAVLRTNHGTHLRASENLIVVIAWILVNETVQRELLFFGLSTQMS